MRNIVQATMEDMEKALVVVPGDGKRIEIALFLTSHDAGADGATIIAMADNREDLLKACLEENLRVEKRPSDYPEHVHWNDQFGIEHGWGEGDLLVLDIPVYSVRSLSLESRGELEESINRIEEKASSPKI